MKSLLKPLSMLLLILGLVANANAAKDPKAMLEGVSEKITTFLEANKAKLAESPDLAKELVRKELLPYIDQEGLCRRVLGKHWKDASSNQQKIFIDKFVDLVINTYAKGLAQYDGQTFAFEDTEYNKAKTAARVRSEMKQKDGAPVKIDYMLKMPKGLEEWRVVDVTIEGISMVQSYRNQFSLQISKEGLNSVIDKLAKNELQLDASGN